MNWIRLAKAVGYAVLAVGGLVGGVVGLIWLMMWLDDHDAGWIAALVVAIIIVTAAFYYLLGTVG